MRDGPPGMAKEATGYTTAAPWPSLRFHFSLFFFFFFLRKSLVRFHPLAMPTINYLKKKKNGNKTKPFNIERLAQPSFPSALVLLRVLSGGLGQDWALFLV